MLINKDHQQTNIFQSKLLDIIIKQQVIEDHTGGYHNNSIAYFTLHKKLGYGLLTILIATLTTH